MKPQLLLLHGALGNSAMMQPLADELKNEFEVFVLGFPGHGGEPFSKERLSMPLLSDALDKFLTDKDIRKPVVFGYSMGGYAALWLEAKNAGTFKSIITLATKFGWDKETVAIETAKLNPSLMKEKIPAFTEMLAERHGKDQWEQLVNETAHLMRMLEEKHLSAIDFAGLNCPVILMSGDQDKMVTPDETKETAAKIPGANCQILENTPHPFEKINIRMLADQIRQYQLQWQ